MHGLPAACASSRLARSGPLSRRLAGVVGADSLHCHVGRTGAASKELPCRVGERSPEILVRRDRELDIALLLENPIALNMVADVARADSLIG
ncbi:hypothetical protein SNK04_014330 [Fusarium graminearum]